MLFRSGGVNEIIVLYPTLKAREGKGEGKVKIRGEGKSDHARSAPMLMVSWMWVSPIRLVRQLLVVRFSGGLSQAVNPHYPHNGPQSLWGLACQCWYRPGKSSPFDEEASTSVHTLTHQPSTRALLSI